MLEAITINYLNGEKEEIILDELEKQHGKICIYDLSDPLTIYSRSSGEKERILCQYYLSHAKSVEYRYELTPIEENK